MQVKHTALTCSNREEIKSLRALEPTSMSWGTICDYQRATDVHRLASSCCAPSTPHFMHSVLWPFDIKGAYILDYGSPKRLYEVLPKTEQQKAYLAERLQIFADGRQLVKENLKSHRAERFMRSAPLELRAHTCEPILGQRFFPKWLEAFKAAAPGSGQGAVTTCRVLHQPEYWLFCGSAHTAHFTLQYS